MDPVGAGVAVAAAAEDEQGSLDMCLLDIHHVTTSKGHPIIIMIGHDRQHRSVAVQVTDYQPYFYVPTPPDYDALEGDIKAAMMRIVNQEISQRDRANPRRSFFYQRLDEMNREAQESRDKQQEYDKNHDSGAPDYHRNRPKAKPFVTSPDPVVDIQCVIKQDAMGFENMPKPFLKVVCSNPIFVLPVSMMLKNKGVMLPVRDDASPDGRTTRLWLAPRVYENKLKFPVRFKIDHAITGCGNVRLTNLQPPFFTRTTCHREFITSARNVRGLDNNAHRFIPQYTTVFFDLECDTALGFPVPETSAVVTMGIVISTFGKPGRKKLVYQLGETTRLPDAESEVHWFETELDMFAAFQALITDLDADFISGFNSNRFDIPYLLDRAKKIGYQFHLSRLKKNPTRYTTHIFESVALGKIRVNKFNLTGRFTRDVYTYLRKNTSAASYSLNALAKEYLGATKEDVPYSEIGKLFRGTPADRARLASYCLQDTVLTADLDELHRILVVIILMARLFIITLEALQDGGQTNRVQTQMINAMEKGVHIVPTMPRLAKGSSYEGATVIAPLKGQYHTPTATLDFQSLYPSIMIAYNICYTTLLLHDTPPDWKEGTDHDYIIAPNGARFATPKHRTGILPRILKETLAARADAKREMKKCPADSEDAKFFNAKQLSLKLCANSVYGFLVSPSAFMPCISLAGAVTAIGRNMIYMCKNALTKLGYVTIYGDTDSVFPLLHEFAHLSNHRIIERKDVMLDPAATAEQERLSEQIEAVGERLANELTKMFPPPIKLEYEKFWWSLLMLNKKRYGGAYCEPRGKADQFHTVKTVIRGMEAVRRDNCQFSRDLQRETLRILLIKKDTNAAVRYVHTQVGALLQHQIPRSKLIFTKGVSKPLDEYPGNMGHINLARRISADNPDNPVREGDRIQYIIEAGVAPLYQRAQLPKTMIDEGRVIDDDHYLTTQVIPPLTRVFGPIVTPVTSAASRSIKSFFSAPVPPPNAADAVPGSQPAPEPERLAIDRVADLKYNFKPAATQYIGSKDAAKAPRLLRQMPIVDITPDSLLQPLPADDRLVTASDLGEDWDDGEAGRPGGKEANDGLGEGTARASDAAPGSTAAAGAAAAAAAQKKSFLDAIYHDFDDPDPLLDTDAAAADANGEAVAADTSQEEIIARQARMEQSQKVKWRRIHGIKTCDLCDEDFMNLGGSLCGRCLAVKKLLFNPGDPHMKRKREITDATHGIMRFGTRVDTCKSCRAPVPQLPSGSYAALCVRCQDRRSVLYLGDLQRMRAAEHRSWILKSNCQRCTKRNFTEIHCENTECQHFFARFEQEREHVRACAELERYNYHLGDIEDLVPPPPPPPPKKLAVEAPAEALPGAGGVKQPPARNVFTARRAQAQQLNKSKKRARKEEKEAGKQDPERPPADAFLMAGFTIVAPKRGRYA